MIITPRLADRRGWMIFFYQAHLVAQAVRDSRAFQAGDALRHTGFYAREQQFFIVADNDRGNVFKKVLRIINLTVWYE